MGADDSMTVEGRKIPSRSVESVLKEFSRGKTELSLLDLAEIRAKGLEPGREIQAAPKDSYVDPSEQTPPVWKKTRVKWSDFLDCSLYIDQLLSTPAEAMIVQKKGLSSPDKEEQIALYVSFSKNFHEAYNIKTLETPDTDQQKPAEEVSRYLVKIIFTQTDLVNIQLIDRVTKPGESFPSRSKFFPFSRSQLESLGLTIDLKEGIKLNDSLKEYLWQIVTKEGPFSSP